MLQLSMQHALSHFYKLPKKSLYILFLQVHWSISATPTCRFIHNTFPPTSTQHHSRMYLYILLQLLPNPTTRGIHHSLTKITIPNMWPLLESFTPFYFSTNIHKLCTICYHDRTDLLHLNNIHKLHSLLPQSLFDPPHRRINLLWHHLMQIEIIYTSHFYLCSTMFGLRLSHGSLLSSLFRSSHFLSHTSFFLCVPYPTIFYSTFPSQGLPLLTHLPPFVLYWNSIHNLLKICSTSSTTINPLSLWAMIQFMFNNEPFWIKVCLGEPFIPSINCLKNLT